MPLDKHVKRGHSILFGFLIFFGIVEASLSTWLTVRYNQNNNYYSLIVRDRTRFIVFTSWWTVFWSFFFLILFLHSPTGSAVTSIGAHLVFFILTWIFWTAAAASITAAISGGFNCRGSPVVYCDQLNALEGFAWAEWILITFGTIVVLLLGIRAVRRGHGYMSHLIN